MEFKVARKLKLGELEGQEIKFMTVEEALNKKLTANVRYYLSGFKDVVKKHLDKKTIPDIKDLRESTNFNKTLTNLQPGK